MKTVATFLFSAFLLSGFPAFAQSLPGLDAALAIDTPMHNDPTLESPPIRIEFDPRLKTLWLAALDRPEIDLRMQAADAIGKAFQQGYADLADTVPKLAAMLGSEKHPLVRLALAEALIRLDAKAHADALFAANQQGDRDMILLTDPALARWKQLAIGDEWNKRAGDLAAPRAIRLSALHSLGMRRDPRFIPVLMTTATDTDEEAALRLAAARSMAKFSSDSLDVYDAAAAMRNGSVADRLVGVTLLRRVLQLDVPNRRPELWISYAGDDEGAIAADAIGQLGEFDPAAIASVQPDPLTRPDANVRTLAAMAWYTSSLPQSAFKLATILDDHDPRTRKFARHAALQLGQRAEWRESVRSAAMGVIESAGWRGLEQASLLLGKLDHEPAAPRFIELLTHERAEIRIAAAVALRWLAAPDALPMMLRHAQMLSQADVKTLSATQRITTTDQLVQIFQAFGVTGYREAEPLMRTFIPKAAPYSSSARAAAIWALGKLYADASDDGLARQLQSRLNDTNPMNPEAIDVRSASAVALGRMKSRSATDALQKFLKEENGSKEIGGACKWALEQITGQTLPPLDTIVERPMDWFLRPVD